MASGTRALPSQPTRTDEESAGWVKACVVAPKHPFDALLGASAAQGPGSRFCCLPPDAKLLLWKPTESRGCSGSPWLSLFPCLLTSASPAPCHFAAPAARELSVFSQNTLLSCLRGWSDSKANIANPEINNPCCIKGSNLLLPRTAALSPGELCFPPAAQQSLRSSGLSAVPTAERPSATCTSVPWSYKQIFPPPTSPPHQFFC